MSEHTHTPQITIEIDHEADAAYIRLSSNSVASTKTLTDDVLVDLDTMGVAVGIEVLSRGAKIPFGRLTTELHIHSTVVELVRQIQPSVSAFSVRSEAEASTLASSPQFESATH
ncbi:DUF2283 domain-containing protein [Cellulomonas sp. HZM]|uniref:DUF2283 domain-containing protein n=1 Tax=Cellulomonas sp. HZM TaxID=1454010 RepID=UPI0006911566|nr:DUF2283 domain-containing protein [Cellulomonas sp. HZM]